MCKKIFIVLTLITTCFYQVYAQRDLKEMDSEKQAEKDRFKDDEANSWREKVGFGGNFTGGLGSGGAFLLVNPQVFYRVLPKTIGGLGFTYIYWSQKYTNYSTNQTVTFSDNAFGLNLFAQQTLFGPIFAHAEYMPMNFTSYNLYGDEKRVWGNSIYLGGGYSSANNGRGGAYILILYDVLWQQDDFTDPKAFSKSFYTSPWNIRIGFML